MKIEIITDGTGPGTKILINGIEEKKLTFFEFSVNTDRSSKAKLFLMKHLDGRVMPLEYYGEGLRKFDEAMNIKGAENGQFIGAKNP